jgi:hypothetical protein
MPMPTAKAPVDTSKADASWLKIAWCQAVSPRPP